MVKIKEDCVCIHVCVWGCGYVCVHGCVCASVCLYVCMCVCEAACVLVQCQTLSLQYQEIEPTLCKEGVGSVI